MQAEATPKLAGPRLPSRASRATWAKLPWRLISSTRHTLAGCEISEQMLRRFKKLPSGPLTAFSHSRVICSSSCGRSTINRSSVGVLVCASSRKGSSIEPLRV